MNATPFVEFCKSPSFQLEWQNASVAELAPPRRGEVNRTKMWHVYILQSRKDGSHYIGCSNDYPRRLREHNNGYNDSTRTKAPWRIVHLEQFEESSKAFVREKQIKSYKGGNGLKKLLH